MKLAIIIVTYFTPADHVEKIKKSLLSLKGEYYIIDNSEHNIGFAAGVNKGIKKAIEEGKDTFLIINPDIYIESLSRHLIEESLSSYDVVGGLMIQDDIPYAGGSIDCWRLSAVLKKDETSDELISVEYVTGSLMIFNKNVIDTIGYLDESFFLYYEDVDFSVRAKKAGLNVGINKKIRYTHYEVSRKNSKKEVYLALNRFKFFRKNATFFQWIRELLRLPRTGIEYLPLIFSLLVHNPFALNFTLLNTTSILSKLLNFLLFFILIRNYSSGDYGNYILVWAHINILSPLLDFGTTSYGLITIKKDQNELIQKLFIFRILLSLIVFVFSLLLILPFNYNSNQIFLVLLASFSIFTNMLFGMLHLIFTLQDKSYKSSLINLGLNTIYTIFLIGIILFLKANLMHIFFVTFVFNIVLSLVYAKLITNILGKISLTFDLKSTIIIIKGSFIFVLLGLFASMYNRLDVFLLKLLKTENEVGIYSAGFKIFEAFMFIATSYNLIAMPFFANLLRNDKSSVPKKIASDTKLLLGISLVLTILVICIPDSVYTYFFSSHFTKSIPVLKVVILGLPFVLIASVYFNILHALKKTYILLYLFLFQIILNIVLNVLFIPLYSYMASAYITLLSEILNVFIIIMLYKRINHET